MLSDVESQEDGGTLGAVELGALELGVFSACESGTLLPSWRIPQQDDKNLKKKEWNLNQVHTLLVPEISSYVTNETLLGHGLYSQVYEVFVSIACFNGCFQGIKELKWNLE